MTRVMQRRRAVGSQFEQDPFVLAASTSASGSTTVGVSDLIEEIDAVMLLQRQYQANTPGLSGALRDPGAPSAISSPADRLAEFKRRTDLTWVQVSRLFGVSKRAVMHWNAGSTMSAGHEERLAVLLSRLNDAPSREPDAVHAWLMTIDESGTAPFQRWVEEARQTESPAAWVDRQPEGQ